jgi:SAM-dependent methyltransferase
VSGPLIGGAAEDQMASLLDRLRGRKPDTPSAESLVSSGGAAAPAWARPLFTAELAPVLANDDGHVLVWTIEDRASTATITDQFKANAEEYHRRYAASDHFQALFSQALAATALKVAERPLILDLGSGSGVNSIVPCRRLFPGSRMVATDLSGELLAMLGAYALDNDAADEVVCVKMDAMSETVSPGAFDLVTGASILHHLDSPERGLNAAARALKPGGHAIFFEPFNGWAIIRLAFERIAAEAALRGVALDPPVDVALHQLIDDVTERSAEAWTPALARKDDKWLFSRSRIEFSARAAGFAGVQFVPHNDHPSLYRDVAGVHFRLATGRDDLALPEWAMSILDSFDAAITLNAKRELMLEGTIVLTKGS